MSATRFGTLITGRLGAAIMAVITAGSLGLAGNLYFDTTDNSTPGVFIDGTEIITYQGNDYVDFNVPYQQLLNGSLALTEANGVKGGSGTQVITNPTDDYLICDAVTFRITTTATPTTSADIYFSTGATVVATGSGVGIADDFVFGVGVVTFTGSSLVGSDVEPRKFVLAPSSSTTLNKSIVIKSKAGTGAGLVGQYDIPCRYLAD